MSMNYCTENEIKKKFSALGFTMYDVLNQDSKIYANKDKLIKLYNIYFKCENGYEINPICMEELKNVLKKPYSNDEKNEKNIICEQENKDICILRNRITNFINPDKCNKCSINYNSDQEAILIKNLQNEIKNIQNDIDQNYNRLFQQSYLKIELDKIKTRIDDITKNDNIIKNCRNIS